MRLTFKSSEERDAWTQVVLEALKTGRGTVDSVNVADDILEARRQRTQPSEREVLLEEYPAYLWPDGPGGGPYSVTERAQQKAHSEAADAQRTRLRLPSFKWSHGRVGPA